MDYISKPGRYSATVTRSFLKKARTGTLQVGIVFETDDGEQVTCYRPLTRKAWEAFVAEDLRLLGWDPRERDLTFEELDNGDDSPLVGQKAEIVVRERTTNTGNRVLHVAFINAPDSGKLSDDERREVGDALRRELLGHQEPEPGDDGPPF